MPIGWITEGELSLPNDEQFGSYVRENGTLGLPNLPVRIVKMTDMGGNPVSYAQNDKRALIKVPSTTPDSIDVIIKVGLAEPWNSDAVIPVEKDKGWFSAQPNFGVKQ